MKKICKVILAAAAIVALAVPAMAADKLIVKDAAGTADVFKVTDAGVVTGAKLGMGTTTPQAPIHLNYPSALGVLAPAGTTLYSVSTGFAGSTQDNSFAADFTVADGTATAGMRGAIRGVRSRGTLLAPAAAAAEDQVLSVLAGVYSGRVVNNAADISFIVDGAVTDGGTQPTTATPVRISFKTRPTGWTWYERMTIKANGNIGINQTAPTSKLHVSGLLTYASNAAAITGGLTAGAFYTDGAGNVKVVY